MRRGIADLGYVADLTKRRRARLLGCVGVTALLIAWPTEGSAQADQASAGGDVHGAASHVPGFRVYLGMWTLHLRDLRRGLQPNWTLGVAWGDAVGGTFINSYGDRAYFAGLQRTAARGGGGTIVPTFGYRIGLMTGYDERFMPLAGKTPVLPLAQLLGGLDSERMGVELAWSGLVSSIGPTLRF